MQVRLCIPWLKRPKQTAYKTALTNDIRVKITHPFLDFNGKEYVVASQYMRCGRLFFQCIDEEKSRIITVPASFTEYYEGYQVSTDASANKTCFTIKSLIEVNNVLNGIEKTSTK